MCAQLRESDRERSGEGENEGGDVYELLNARLATGGSSSDDPIKTGQNGESVQLLADLTSNNAAGSGHNRVRKTTLHQETTFLRFLQHADAVVNVMRFV